MRNKKNIISVTDKTQIRKYPPCDNFDIPLLHKTIKIACENVAEFNDAK